MRFLMLLVLLITSACSTIKTLSLRGAAPLFVEGSYKLTQERSWDFFQQSIPANLKLLEMLYLQDPKNMGLLQSLVKGYSGYAYAVPETLAFGDELAGIEESIHKKNAIMFYTRALDYGLTYLKLRGISRKQLLEGDQHKLTDLFKDQLSKRDLTPLLFTGHAWAGLINLQRDNVALVSHVPRVKIIFDWICKIDENIENGFCDIFYAQYEASRPRMLGGNPEKGAELYQVAMKKRPQHLLMRVGYLQFSVIPAFDQEMYETQSKLLKEEFLKWEDLNRDTLENNSEYKAFDELNLFNAIARKRFELMEAYKLKIFEG
jgi:hypothetical protein